MRASLIGATLALACAVMTGAAHAALDIDHWTTENGARVYFVAAPEIPIVDVRFVFNAGSARDGDSPGLARLVGQLITEGAGDWDANEFHDRLADTGAEFSSGALRDMAWVSLRSLSDPQYLEPSLELLREVLARPRFDDDAVARNKANALVHIKREQQSPAAIASKAFYRAVYRDHPYASPLNGTEASVGEIERKDIVKFHERFYVAQNATIAIVGDLSRDSAAAIAERLAAGLKPGAPPPALTPVAALDSAAEHHVEFPSI